MRARRLRELVAMPPPPLRLAAASATLLLLGALFWAGAQPFAVGLIPAPWDKAAHLLLFFVLGLVASLALGPRLGGLALAMCVLVGGADELAQLLHPGREVALSDWLADLIGVLLAGIFVQWLRRPADPPA